MFFVYFCSLICDALGSYESPFIKNLLKHGARKLPDYYSLYATSDSRTVVTSHGQVRVLFA